jgi:integrase
VPAAGGGAVRLDAKPIDAITKADVEAVRAWRRQALEARAFKARRPGVKRGEVGLNRLLARLRHVFNWAIAEGYVEASPFKRHGVTVVRLTHAAETPRTRRLLPAVPGRGDAEGTPSEEDRLIAHAPPLLRALIVAALSTGCRLGELLSLQWAQVRRDEHGVARWITLPGSKTKTAAARVVPIGPRLRAELEMRRTAPDGKDHDPAAHVFGDECGGRVPSIRTLWEDTCAAAAIAGLHFHDLRREFACRLLESSADLHDIQAFLGHMNVTTTSTYLASTPVRLARALDRLDPEPAAAPDGAVGTPDSHTICTEAAAPASVSGAIH